MDFFPTDFKIQSPHEDIVHHHHDLCIHSNQILTSSCLMITVMCGAGLGPALPGRHPPSMLFPGLGMETEDLSGDYGPQQTLGGGRKKIRLKTEQVKALEMSFEAGNKLDSVRKLKLARALGLQPRQVAIWFQNRRGRCKIKRLEKDYDNLKHRFDSVKAVNDALLAQNQRLQEEVLALRGVRGSSTTSHYESINLNRETEGCGSTISSSKDKSCSDTLRLNVSSSTRLSSAIIEQDHELHLQHQDHHHHHHQHQTRIMISRELSPSTEFDNLLGGISSDHPLGRWPCFEQHQHQQPQS